MSLRASEYSEIFVSSTCIIYAQFKGTTLNYAYEKGTNAAKKDKTTVEGIQ